MTEETARKHTTTQARQGVTGHHVRTVLGVSLALAAVAGVVILGYFWTGVPSH
jgi:hypothetical protein